MADTEQSRGLQHVAPDMLNASGLSEKEKVLARIHARRAGQGLAAAKPSSAAAAATDAARVAPQAALQPLNQAASNAAVLLESAGAQARDTEVRTFPRSMTLRLALQNPGSFALGLGLLWKLGSARLLLLRAVLALLRK
jgi:hypothetical protein